MSLSQAGATMAPTRTPAILTRTPTVPLLVTKTFASSPTVSAQKMVRKFREISVPQTIDATEYRKWSQSPLMTPSTITTLTCMLKSLTNREETPTDVTSRRHSLCLINIPTIQLSRICTGWDMRLLLTLSLIMMMRTSGVMQVLMIG